MLSSGGGTLVVTLKSVCCIANKTAGLCTKAGSADKSFIGLWTKDGIFLWSYYTGNCSWLQNTLGILKPILGSWAKWWLVCVCVCVVQSMARAKAKLNALVFFYNDGLIESWGQTGLSKHRSSRNLSGRIHRCSLGREKTNNFTRTRTSTMQCYLKRCFLFLSSQVSRSSLKWTNLGSNSG